jgi:hypothetical protein
MRADSIIKETIETAAFSGFGHRKSGKVEEWDTGNSRKLMPDDVFALGINRCVFFQYFRFRPCKDAIETAQYGER